MIVSSKTNTTNRVVSRWLPVCVLLCAVLVLPFGVAYAQDFDAVEKRLGQGVAEGELTLKQAAAMMDALRKTRGEARDRDEEERREGRAGVEARLKAVGERLKAAVKAGKLSEKEAWGKWHEIKEEGIAPRLKAAVKAGEMTEEAAWAIWRRIEKAEVGARLKAVGERLKAAVKAGKMSEKEARAKWEAIKKGAEAKDKDGRRDDRGDRGRADAYLREVWGKLQAAVKAGKMSQEDAHKKMGEIKREVFSRLKDKDGRGDDRGDRAKADAYLREVWGKLQAAVKAGKMSEKDAHRKMGEVKKGVAARLRESAGRGHDKADRDSDKDDRGRADAYLRGAWARLQAAVKAGKMSEKDAHKKMGAIKKKVLGERSPRSK